MTGTSSLHAGCLHTTALVAELIMSKEVHALSEAASPSFDDLKKTEVRNYPQRGNTE